MARIVAVGDASLHVYQGEGDSTDRATETKVISAGESYDVADVPSYVVDEVKAGKNKNLVFVEDDSEAAAVEQQAASGAQSDDDWQPMKELPPVTEVETAQIGPDAGFGNVGESGQVHSTLQVEQSLGVTPDGREVFGSSATPSEALAAATPVDVAGEPAELSAAPLVRGDEKEAPEAAQAADAPEASEADEAATD